MHFQNAVITARGLSKVPSLTSLASTLIHIQPAGGEKPGVACLEDFNGPSPEGTHTAFPLLLWRELGPIILSNAREAA